MEAIIAVVGFLGAGKTTLLKRLITHYAATGWSPFVILNDYENAQMEVQQLTTQNASDSDSTSKTQQPEWIRPLSGSCICCSGIVQLRDFVNSVPEREKGITLIEANGTSDACQLMGFLGIGLDKRFLPPVQISVVDVKNWQQRGEHNELEANQVQVSSLIILTHLKEIPNSRRELVVAELKQLNPSAIILNDDELDIDILSELSPSTNNQANKLDHKKAHWSSCSAELPDVPNVASIKNICERLPKNILRVKGCVKIDNEKNYTYFERLPDGEVHIRPYNGVPVMGSKILIVGPGSEHALLDKVIASGIQKSVL